MRPHNALDALFLALAAVEPPSARDRLSVGRDEESCIVWGDGLALVRCIPITGGGLQLVSRNERQRIVHDDVEGDDVDEWVAAAVQAACQSLAVLDAAAVLQS